MLILKIYKHQLIKKISIPKMNIILKNLLKTYFEDNVADILESNIKKKLCLMKSANQVKRVQILLE